MTSDSWNEGHLHHALAAVVMLLATAFAWHSNPLLLERPALRRGATIVPSFQTTGPVRDATGANVPRGHYQRIVVMDGIDHLLWLIPAGSIVGVGDWPVDHSLEGWRIADRPRISDRHQIERILACHPDLVVTCSMGNPELREDIASLRSVGVTVFDLSYTVTFQDLLGQITCLSAVLEIPERGAGLRRALQYRCDLLRTPPQNVEFPRRGMFICTWENRVAVAGDDDIFDDIVTGAGLRNAGAEAGLHLSPVISLERALNMDPQEMVTRPRNRPALIALPGIDSLVRSGKVKLSCIPEPFIGSAAPLDFVDTVESIHDHVYSHQP